MNTAHYIPKTKQLQDVFRSIWQVNGFRPYQTETIIPKGVVEIIFDLSENVPVRSLIDNKELQLAKCFINGFNTFPIELLLPEQQFFFGVQFHPSAIKHLLGVPSSEFTNRTIDLTLLSQSFHSLWQQLAEVKTFDERVIIISQWIERKIIQPHPQEILLNAFLEDNNSHTLTIKDLANKIYYSPRHLSRKISELTGMNAEQFLLYKKYLHSVHLIHTTNLSLTDITYHSNFADQSHFIKSFKAFAQITPNDYRQTKSFVPGHILKNVR